MIFSTELEIDIYIYIYENLALLLNFRRHLDLSSKENFKNKYLKKRIYYRNRHMLVNSILFRTYAPN